MSSEDFKKTLASYAAEKTRFVMENRERFITAWVSETGLQPTETVMCEQTTIGDDGSVTTRVWMVRKGEPAFCCN